MSSSDILDIIRYIVCKYFFSFCRLSFHFVDGFFCCAEAYLSDVIPLIFYFVACALVVISPKNHCQDLCQRALFSYVFF